MTVSRHALTLKIPKRLLRAAASLTLAAALAAGAAPAGAEELTTDEKFRELVEAGIFDGMDDGSARLDETMTRAQAAKIVALLLGLEAETAKPSDYLDIAQGHWAAGYIGAATEAGILNGVGQGMFNPNGEMTMEQLAAVFVRTLDLEVDEDASVDGASDWAQAYVAAAVKAGIIAPQDDYTKPASREQLVLSTFEANPLVRTSDGETVQAEYERSGRPVLHVESGESTVKQAGYTLSGTVYPRDAAIRANGHAATPDSAGRWTIALDLKPGANRIAVTATDRREAVSSATVEVSYDVPPTLEAIGSRTSTVGLSASIAVSGKDEGGDKLTYTAEGLPAGVAIDAATGSISGRPSAEGSYSVKVTVSDPAGQTASQSFEWTIAPAPVSVVAPAADTTAPLIADYSGTVTVGEAVYGTSNESGTIYLTYENVSVQPNRAQLEQMVGEGRAAKKPMSANVRFTFDTSLLAPGSLNLYAADAAGNVSLCAFVLLQAASTPPPDPTDATDPIISGHSETVNAGSGYPVSGTSNESGTIYLTYMNITAKPSPAELEQLVSEGRAAKQAMTAGVPFAFQSYWLSPGSYNLYAVDASGNVSDCAFVAVLSVDATPPVVDTAVIVAPHPIGMDLDAVSNEYGWIYVVDVSSYDAAAASEGVVTKAELDALPADKLSKGDAAPDQLVHVPTGGLAPGSYKVIAVDTTGNVSAPWQDNANFH